MQFANPSSVLSSLYEEAKLGYLDAGKGPRNISIDKELMVNE